MEGAPNCYKCKYRSGVPGSTHSSCNHPKLDKAHGEPLSAVLAIFASVGRVEPIQGRGAGIHVEGHPHGISKGWFNHPWNFDPTWLVSCDGFVEARITKNG